MKLLLIVLLTSSTLFAKEIHPLKHPKCKVITVPLGKWYDGFIYIHDVMDYIFKTDNERKLALQKLSEVGFSGKETSFFYSDGQKFTINGHVFENVSQAVEYLKKSKIKEIRVFTKEEAFPKKLKMSKVKFYIIPWDKRHLPRVNL